LTGGTYWNCTDGGVIDFTTVPLPGFSGYSFPYNCYAPTVAVGGASYAPGSGDARQYLVSSFADYHSSNDVLIMEPIDYAASTSVASPGYYYWVSQYPTGDDVSSPYNYTNGVASSANHPAGYSLEAWGDISPFYAIYYKFTSYPYAFRQSPASVASTTRSEWQAYPNPANDELNLSHADGTEYRITDMAGNTVLYGDITNGSARAGVGMLAAGSYALVVYKNGEMSGEKMFVKE